MNVNLKYYKIFGKKWYPALMQYQLGIHATMIPLGIWGTIDFIITRLCFWPILVCCVFEIIALMMCFDEKKANHIEKYGWSKIDDDPYL